MDQKILYIKTCPGMVAYPCNLTIQKGKAGKFLKIWASADYLVSSRPTSALNKALSQNICIYVYMKSTQCMHTAARLAQEKRDGMKTHGKENASNCKVGKVRDQPYSLVQIGRKKPCSNIKLV